MRIGFRAIHCNGNSSVMAALFHAPVLWRAMAVKPLPFMHVCQQVFACFDRIACPSGVIASYLHASPSPGLGKMGAVVALVDKQGKLEGAAADKAHVRCQLHTEVMYCFASVCSILSGTTGNADGIEAVFPMCRSWDPK